MIIPLWVNEDKDKELIDWLNTKTNKSAVIREVLYSYIKGIGFNNSNLVNKETEIDDNFMNSLKSFE